MKLFRLIATIIIAGILIVPAKAQNQNEDAIYTKLVKEYTLKPDGSTEFHLEKQLKLLSQMSFNRLYGETFIVYNPQYQKLSINKAFTVTADGKTVKTPNNAFNEVLPSAAANNADFNQMREMVVTHTATETGAVIHLDYSLTSNKDFIPFLMGKELVGENSPVEELIIKIKMPAGKPLNYQLYNSTQQPKKQKEGKMDVYQWVFRNVAPLSNENFQEWNMNSIPRLIFSSTDMKTAIQWMTSKPGFNAGLTPAIKAKVDELLKGENNDVNKMLKVQSLVATEISSIPLPMASYGYNPRTPERVWNSNGGTKLEKAILLSAILNYAGIEATPMMGFTTAYFDQKIGSFIADISVQVKPEKSEMLLISPDQKDITNHVYIDGGCTFIRLDHNYSNFINPFIKNELSLDGEFNWAPSDNTLKGNCTIEMKNACNPFFDLVRDSSHIKNYLNGGISAKDISKASLTRLQVDVTKGKLDISKENALNQQSNNYWLFDLPVLRNGIDDWHLTATLIQDRKIPIEIPEIIEENYQYSIQIPEGYVLVNKPVNIETENKVARLKINIHQEGHSIIIKRSASLLKKIISGDDYAQFRDIIIQWNNKNYRTVVLKKEGL